VTTGQETRIAIGGGATASALSIGANNSVSGALAQGIGLAFSVTAPQSVTASSGVTTITQNIAVTVTTSLSLFGVDACGATPRSREPIRSSVSAPALQAQSMQQPTFQSTDRVSVQSTAVVPQNGASAALVSSASLTGSTALALGNGPGAQLAAGKAMSANGASALVGVAPAKATDTKTINQTLAIVSNTVIDASGKGTASSRGSSTPLVSADGPHFQASQRGLETTGKSPPAPATATTLAGADGSAGAQSPSASASAAGGQAQSAAVLGANGVVQAPISDHPVQTIAVAMRSDLAVGAVNVGPERKTLGSSTPQATPSAASAAAYATGSAAIAVQSSLAMGSGGAQSHVSAQATGSPAAIGGVADGGSTASGLSSSGQSAAQPSSVPSSVQTSSTGLQSSVSMNQAATLAHVEKAGTADAGAAVHGLAATQAPKQAVTGSVQSSTGGQTLTHATIEGSHVPDSGSAPTAAPSVVGKAMPSLKAGVAPSSAIVR
jgi:hypothetical protein